MALDVSPQLSHTRPSWDVWAVSLEDPVRPGATVIAQAQEDASPDQTDNAEVTTDTQEAVPSPAAEAQPGEATTWWVIGIAIVLAAIFIVWWHGRRRRRQITPGATQTGEFLGRSKRERR